MSNQYTFSSALQALKKGKRVQRQGWNGKGMWLKLIENGFYDVGVSCIYKDSMIDYKVELSPWIGMKTADNKFVPWLASQTDMLAEDWEVLEDG